MRNKTSKRRANARYAYRGISLIEVIVVVMIIGILAGIAYPSYQNQVRKSRRADGELALARVAGAQENFFSECGYYATTVTGTRACGVSGNASAVLGSSATSPEGYYNMSVSAGAINSAACSTLVCGFIAIATPVTQQVLDGTLRLDSMGVRQRDANRDGVYTSGENTWK